MNDAGQLQGDYALTVCLRGFLELPRKARLVVINGLVNAIREANELYLQQNPRTPKLYASGVRYVEDLLGAERWKNVPEVLANGAGDCKDLAAWRCAEIRRSGELARIQIDEYPDLHDYGPDYHVVVQRADGSIEDPSRVLGMA